MADLVVEAPFATQVDTSRLYHSSDIWPANLRRLSRWLVILTVLYSLSFPRALKWYTLQLHTIYSLH